MSSLTVFEYQSLIIRDSYRYQFEFSQCRELRPPVTGDRSVPFSKKHFFPQLNIIPI